MAMWSIEHVHACVPLCIFCILYKKKEEVGVAGEGSERRDNVQHMRSTLVSLA